MKIFDLFRTFWRKIEKQVLYLLIMVAVITQWLAVFIPSLGFLTPQINPALSSTLLLAILRLFDYHLDKQSIQAHGESFTEAIDSIMTTGSSINSLDIFAHTTSKYFGVIRNKNIRIKNVRLLVPTDESIENSISPTDIEDKLGIIEEKKITLKKWQSMKNDGCIDNLLIHEYHFIPYFHFAIVNQKQAVFGIFRPIESNTGVKTLTNRSIRGNNTSGGEMIKDLGVFFNAIFDDFSIEKVINGSNRIK